MTFKTITDMPIDAALVTNYLHSLVNSFFKILPIKENGEPSLDVYIRSLQIELLGLSGLLVEIKHDAQFLTLISILQYLIDHPECDKATVKREVFKGINICNKLADKYQSHGGDRE